MMKQVCNIIWPNGFSEDIQLTDDERFYVRTYDVNGELVEWDFLSDIRQIFKSPFSELN